MLKTPFQPLFQGHFRALVIGFHFIALVRPNAITMETKTRAECQCITNVAHLSGKLLLPHSEDA